MNSLNIVSVFKFDENEWFYFMELMDCDLKKYIEKNPSLDFKGRVQLCKQLISAVRYLHNKGILHRDLASENILLKKFENLIILKISDFGIVKDTKEINCLTRTDTIVKGRNYDPILINSEFKNYSVQNDLYMLTNCIYFILTGRSKWIPDKTTNEIKTFYNKGIHESRYNSINELEEYFKKIKTL